MQWRGAAAGESDGRGNQVSKVARVGAQTAILVTRPARADPSGGEGGWE